MLEEEEEKDLIWRLEIGWYPGILFGVRTYKEEGYSIHVLYLPFFELALTMYH